MHTSLVVWCLKLMVLLQPPEVTPWAVTYGVTADAIVSAAERDPLFQGNVPATVALEVSLAWFESRFDAHARGDGGASLGLFQISPSTAPGELEIPSAVAPVALRLIRQSFSICKDRPHNEWLAWYAHGGNGCSEKGATASKHRLGKAVWLMKNHPFGEFHEKDR